MLSSSGQDADAAIRQTDTDAAVARLSATQKHYVQDPFIKYFVPRAHLQPPRPPLINIGTFVRSTAIDELVEQWLLLSERKNQRCQIVSLGAGSDTRYWRIMSGVHKDALATYIEIDFPEITTKKAMMIKKSRELSALLGSSEEIRLDHGGTGLHAPKYHLLAGDMRQPPSAVMGGLLAAEDMPILSPTRPTLLLFECVLAYMSPTASSALLRWFADYFSKAEESGALSVIIYEMFKLHDAFGRVMVNNLKARHVSLLGAEPFTTEASLPSRLLDNGFTSASALTLKEIRQTCVERSELERISTLEFLDEVEELDLVLDHYAVTWGLCTSEEEGWSEWGLKRKVRDGC